MSPEIDALLAKLEDDDDVQPCDACFLHCEPSEKKKTYPCPEPLRRWAARHKWSAMDIYEEE